MYRSSISVLIVERNPNLRAILHEALRWYYRVVIQPDPASAFSYLFNGNIPDLIIVGYCRSEIEIQDFLFELQQNYFFKRIPLLLLSNDPKFSGKEMAHQFGVKYLLSKPFNPQEILRYTDLILNPNEQFP